MSWRRREAGEGDGAVRAYRLEGIPLSVRLDASALSDPWTPASPRVRARRIGARVGTAERRGGDPSALRPRRSDREHPERGLRRDRRAVGIRACPTGCVRRLLRRQAIRPSVGAARDQAAVRTGPGSPQLPEMADRGRVAPALRLAARLHRRGASDRRSPRSRPGPAAGRGVSFSRTTWSSSRATDGCEVLRDVERSVGLRSSWNFVPERHEPDARYEVEPATIDATRERRVRGGGPRPPPRRTRPGVPADPGTTPPGDPGGRRPVGGGRFPLSRHAPNLGLDAARSGSTTTPRIQTRIRSNRARGAAAASSPS